jgi:hypothetical protein
MAASPQFATRQAFVERPRILLEFIASNSEPSQEFPLPSAEFSACRRLARRELTPSTVPAAALRYAAQDLLQSVLIAISAWTIRQRAARVAGAEAAFSLPQTLAFWGKRSVGLAICLRSDILPWGSAPKKKFRLEQ